MEEFPHSLRAKVDRAMDFTTKSLAVSYAHYFDYPGVLHSVIITKNLSTVLRMTRLEDIPYDLPTPFSHVFRVKPEYILMTDVKPVFKVPENQILDIVVYDEHVEDVRRLKSGDMVVIMNLHFTTSGGLSISLHGRNKNIEMSNLRGVYVIDDDFDEVDAFNQLRSRIDEKIERRPVVVPAENGTDELEDSADSAIGSVPNN